MLDGSAHILGANQIGMSFTVGLGHRPPKGPLHENSIAAGVAAPPGITIYGWATPATIVATSRYEFPQARISFGLATCRLDRPRQPYSGLGSTSGIVRARVETDDATLVSNGEVLADLQAPILDN